ncbi:hypothetical protein [Amycolatopsis sp. H20-H5]|jgi:antitoxin (DNA-binding transcriptional repressor) of toxin-antitoxin stability system|uniref:hypothetical protein n=1 Tax=Amycolatopsis sp. H20-H5 TaxID=3046309 RepID=UPI002DBA50A8|nr:hypothetical protein [Amycolatopsis sp. H20-H5]MEC3978946.1 hypothetical protein [Amycolatopsis sp. H20-H5]
MTWARHSSRPNPAEDQSWLAGVRAEEEVRLTAQNGRAARIVAGHSSDALDCAELLAMLGLEAEEGRRAQLA